MDTTTSVFLKIEDENTLWFWNTNSIAATKYVDLLCDFMISDDFSELYCLNNTAFPDKVLLRLKQQLFICKVHTACLIFTHIDDVQWELKQYYKDTFLENLYKKYNESLVYKNLKLSLNELQRFLNIYWQGFEIHLPYSYVQMSKRYRFFLNYKGVYDFIEYPKDEDLEKLKPYLIKWHGFTPKTASQTADAALNAIVCNVEEFMTFPVDAEGKISSKNIGNISNVVKWSEIAKETIDILKNKFEKIICYKDDPYFFETDYDNFEKLNILIHEGIDESIIRIADKYRLWVSQIFHKDWIYMIAFYDTEGDSRVGIDVRVESKPFSILHPFEKKKKLIISAGVYGFSPNALHLYANEKLEYGFGKENVKLIRSR